MTHRPANVPQRHANQAMHARYAAHARTFFLSDFVSIENKGSEIQLPKLVVRVRFPSPAPSLLSTDFSVLRTAREQSQITYNFAILGTDDLNLRISSTSRVSASRVKASCLPSGDQAYANSFLPASQRVFAARPIDGLPPNAVDPIAVGDGCPIRCPPQSVRESYFRRRVEQPERLAPGDRDADEFRLRGVGRVEYSRLRMEVRRVARSLRSADRNEADRTRRPRR